MEDAIPAPHIERSHVYAMAVICLIAGLGIGYLMRSSVLAVPHAEHAAITPPHGAMPPGHSLEQWKQMSDQKAAPLLEKLQTNPNDASLLAQVAALYHTTHRFKEAAEYYTRAVNTDPKNVALRTRLASSLYRGGDVDGAIAQLNAALNDSPRDANALYDLGMIKLQGKGDSRGAVAAWQRLLKTNPDLSPDRKAVVLKVMAGAMQMMGDQHSVNSTGGSHAN